MISTLRPIPLYIQLADLLREEIAQGVLPSGARLPTEAELCARHELSRATVRQALGLLADEGLIVRSRGRTSFVASVPATTYAVTELRGFLESLAAQGLAPRAEPLSLETICADERTAAMLELPDGASVLRLERLILVSEEPLLLDTVSLPAGLGAAIAPAQLRQQPIYRLLESALDAPLAGVRQTIGASAADGRESRLLQIEPGSPVLRITRLAYLTRGRPVLCGIGVFRADRYQERIWLRRPGTPTSALASVAWSDDVATAPRHDPPDR